MLDAALLKQLNHPEVEKRKQAVMALAKTKDREALSYLAAVYRGDSDSEVRELARKAGIYINKHADDAPSAEPTQHKDDHFGIGAVSDDLDQPTPLSVYQQADPQDLMQEVQVSALDQERASGLVKQALDLHMRGEDVRAQKYLKDALKKNPNLVRDSYTAGLAGTILGMEPERAIRVVADEAFNQEKRKAKTSDSAGRDEPTWGAAAIDLTIYFLVNAGLAALVTFIIIGTGVNLLNQIVSNETFVAGLASSDMTPADVQMMFDEFASVGFVSILTSSLVYGATTVILQFIYYVMIHVISTTMLGGDGSLPNLITKITIPLAFFTPSLLLVGVALFALGFLYPDLLCVLALVMIGVGFGFSFWLAGRIGAVYEMGTGKGCASMVFANIALSFVSAIFNTVLGTAMIFIMFRV